MKKKARQEEAERFAKELEERKAAGIIDDVLAEENNHYEEFYCEVCAKGFKTENQL